MIWSSKDLSEALNIEVNPGIYSGQIQFNSNSVDKNDLFIALKANGDGHDYVAHALERGAGAVIISRVIENIATNKVIMVEDTLNSLHKLAEYKRKKSKAKFIAVTGSVGKTTTKEAMKTMLGHFANSFASRGNFNNYLGVLINLASMPDNIEYAIFEMGMSHAGEIKELTKMVQPDIAVITTLSEAHLEFFNSMLDLTDAKCEIFENMTKDAIAVINIDSKYYDRILLNLEKFSINNVYSFGKSLQANARFTLYEKLDREVHLVYSINNININIKIPFIPEHYAKNFAACLMVTSLLGQDVQIASLQLSKILLTEGRGKIIKVTKHGQDYHLICDYYNASPESVKASLEYLKQLSHPKKIAIIGDMLELGSNSVKLHENLVPFIIDSGARRIFLVGANSKHIYISLPSTIEKIHFDKVESLIEHLNDLMTGDELILIKGSRSMRLDEIVQYFEVA